MSLPLQSNHSKKWTPSMKSELNQWNCVWRFVWSASEDLCYLPQNMAARKTKNETQSLKNYVLGRIFHFILSRLWNYFHSILVDQSFSDTWALISSPTCLCFLFSYYADSPCDNYGFHCPISIASALWSLVNPDHMMQSHFIEIQYWIQSLLILVCYLFVHLFIYSTNS